MGIPVAGRVIAIDVRKGIRIEMIVAKMQTNNQPNNMHVTLTGHISEIHLSPPITQEKADMIHAAFQSTNKDVTVVFEIYPPP
jgi:hypothetical protein